MNTNNCKISIIVPVYNTSRYLPRCVDSLISQTIKDIEIIIINDGSTDNSQGIIDEYANSHPHIITLVQSNSGVSAARNLGLKSAHGEYIGFVDSDDWCDITMFEKLYNLAKINGSDIACCNFIAKYSDHDKNYDTVQKIVSNRYTSEPVIWNKIIRSSFLKDHHLKFTENIIHEDFELHYKTCALTTKISYTSEFLYYYECSNADSYTYSSTLNINDLTIVCRNLLTWQQASNINDNLFLYNLQRLMIFYTLNQHDLATSYKIWELFQPIFAKHIIISRKFTLINQLYKFNFKASIIIFRFLYKILNSLKKQ